VILHRHSDHRRFAASEVFKLFGVARQRIYLIANRDLNRCRQIAANQCVQRRASQLPRLAQHNQVVSQTSQRDLRFQDVLLGNISNAASSVPAKAGTTARPW
jgi:hypothetical protein